jgi:4-aminobutyrate aminotransferase
MIGGGGEALFRRGLGAMASGAEHLPPLDLARRFFGDDGGIMPLAAILAARRLDHTPEAALGHYAHEKSPVACAAALAMLDVIEEQELIARARRLGARSLERLCEMKSGHPVIHDMSLGCYFGVEIGGHDPIGFADRLLYRCSPRASVAASDRVGPRPAPGPCFGNGS